MLRNLLLGGASHRALFAPETGAGTAAPAASESTPAPVAPTAPTAAASEGPLSIRQAADTLAARRDKPADDKLQQPRVNGRFASATPPADESSADPAQDAAPLEASGDPTEADPAATPPIEPPRSWTKEDKAWFAGLPPETQSNIAERERSREEDFSHRQNEASKAQKAAEAERQAIQQQRLQYEQALPQLLERLQRQAMGEFADIKTHDDVVKMATDDPFRFNRWQAVQEQSRQVAQEVEATQRRQAEDQRKAFEAWSAEQDKTFTEQVKDFADAAKAPKIREGIVGYLTEVRGVPKETLPELWNNPLFRDARMQAIVHDAYRWNEAQKAAKAAAQKTVPAPTRPGVAPNKGAAGQATIQQLEAKLSSAKTTREQVTAAAALTAAKRVNRASAH